MATPTQTRLGSCILEPLKKKAYQPVTTSWEKPWGSRKSVSIPVLTLLYLKSHCLILFVFFLNFPLKYSRLGSYSSWVHTLITQIPTFLTTHLQTLRIHNLFILRSWSQFPSSSSHKWLYLNPLPSLWATLSSFCPALLSSPWLCCLLLCFSMNLPNMNLPKTCYS